MARTGMPEPHELIAFVHRLWSEHRISKNHAEIYIDILSRSAGGEATQTQGNPLPRENHSQNG